MFNFIKKYLLNLLLIVSLFFLINYFVKINILEKIKSLDISDSKYFCFSIILILISRLLEYFAWFRITQGQNINFNKRKTFSIWSMSEVIKYIPGKVFFLYSKFSLYSNFESKKIIYCLYSEFFLSLISLFFLIIIFFPLSNYFIEINILIYLIISLIFIICSVAFYFVLVNKIQIFFKLNLEIKLKKIIDVIIIYLFSIIIYAFSLVSLFFSINNNLDIHMTGLVIFNFFVSNLASIVIFFIPAGIGVRELFFIEFTSTLILSDLVYCIVILRFLTIIVELLMYLTNLFANRFTQNIYNKL